MAPPSPPTDDTADVTALARELAAELATRAAEADRLGRLPPEDVTALRAARYPGLSAPVHYGGRGCTLGACVAAQLELAKGSGSTALVAAMTLHAIGHARETRRWPEAVFAELSRAAAGGALLNFAASEPALGSPARGGLPQTGLRPDGAGYLRLDGRKTWVTGGSHLEHVIVRARLGDGAADVWVPASTPGVRWERTWGDGLSLRASDSHDLLLEGVRLPENHLLPEEEGAKSPNVWFPLLIAATYLGMASAARDAAIRYALERTPTALGRPIATLPRIQRQIGEIDVALQSARTLLLSTAESWSGDPADGAAFLPRAAAAKHLATETALTVTDQALRVAGAAAVGRELPLERYFRDVRAGPMHPPSGDAALEAVGREALGL